MEIGTYMPEGDLVRGRYVGIAEGLKGATCLMADRGEFWSVQVDQHRDGLMVYGWWKCPKEDWARLYTVREALEAVKDGKKWARPIWWRGHGLAICVYCEYRLAVVPSATGGTRWNVNIKDMLSDWEVVDPNTVLDEVEPKCQTS